MNLKKVPKSPVVPADRKWRVDRRADGYESDVTAFVRSLVADEAIREDQRWAWERWRNESARRK
ncbi:MAG: hypothetical protein IT529_17595 [Burkholderiales bacterium]|nr:hypothetical protein [Burkholderiales bacterium]